MYQGRHVLAFPAEGIANTIFKHDELAKTVPFVFDQISGSKIFISLAENIGDKFRFSCFCIAVISIKSFGCIHHGEKFTALTFATLLLANGKVVLPLCIIRQGLS